MRGIALVALACAGAAVGVLAAQQAFAWRDLSGWLPDVVAGWTLIGPRDRALRTPPTTRCGCAPAAGGLLLVRLQLRAHRAGRSAVASPCTPPISIVRRSSISPWRCRRAGRERGSPGAESCSPGRPPSSVAVVGRRRHGAPARRRVRRHCSGPQRGRVRQGAGPWAIAGRGLAATSRSSAPPSLPTRCAASPARPRAAFSTHRLRLFARCGGYGHPAQRGSDARRARVARRAGGGPRAHRRHATRRAARPARRPGSRSASRSAPTSSSTTRPRARGASAGRVATPVTVAGRRVAVVVHEPLTLDDAATRAAVFAAVGLAAERARLRAEVGRQADASRRRAGGCCWPRTRSGGASPSGSSAAGAALADVELLVRAAGTGRPPSARGRARPGVQAARPRPPRLDTLVRGLGGVDRAGLVPALERLADSRPLAIDLELADVPVSPEVASALWFVCSESLANAVKHAEAQRDPGRALGRERHRPAERRGRWARRR